MNSKTIATKYLKLIVFIALALIGYRLYKANLQIPFIGKSAKSTASNAISKEDIAKRKQTSERIKSYEDYLNAMLRDLKTLEASSSIDINKDLYLDKLYLEDL